MVVRALDIWLIVVVTIALIYTIRHWVFTFSRIYGKQRVSYADVQEHELPTVSVLVPMHNEALVAARCLESLLANDYPASRIEFVAINDHSDDGTAAILDRYARTDSRVRVVTVEGSRRGKSIALNAALATVESEIVLVFDADYMPGQGLLRTLTSAFVDPKVGAVMGRVVPSNAGRNLLTRLLAMERSGGYQVDQQARYNLDLLPQYGGTVGGFRRKLIEAIGGFDPFALAEDTELSATLFLRGSKIVYDNRAECYEEVPETWAARFRQLRRWSRGHTRVLWRHFGEIFTARGLTFWQRLDTLLLLFSYLLSPLLISGWLAALALFCMGRLPAGGGIVLAFCVVLYNTFGNFAPLFQVAAAEVLDGSTAELRLLPYLFFVFPLNAWAVTVGAIDAVGDAFKGRRGKWEKTARSAPSGVNP
jgi:cellulose synthase/poly-beta-1,6-N-acetylglucosamine synthase-like glycosyltransferase